MATIETTSVVPHLREYGSPQPRDLIFSILNILARLEQQLERRRTRIALLEMNDDQLKGIALSRSTPAAKRTVRSGVDVRSPCKA
jgi:uncharacterized protein YjiS (DUF1127 family)